MVPKPILNFNNIQSQIPFEEDIKLINNMKCINPELVLRRKRSKKYINLIKELDIAGHNISQAKIDEIINTIKNELPELSVDEFPIGIVAKCYLGEPFEVHTLTLIGKSIIEHYKSGESLPEELEKARNLANNEHYEFVEVYKTKMIAIKEDGSASIINDNK